MPVCYSLNFLSAFLTACLFPDFILRMLAPGVSTSGRRREHSIHQMDLQNGVSDVDLRRWEKEESAGLWPEVTDWLLRCLVGCLIHGTEFLVRSWRFSGLYSGGREIGPPGKRPPAEPVPFPEKSYLQRFSHGVCP